jgi:hypothetical protein
MKKSFQTIIILMLSVIVLFSCQSNPKQNDTKDNEIIPNHELVKTDNLEIIENSESDVQWENISRQSVTLEGYPLSKCIKLLVGKTGAKVFVEGLDHDPVMYIAYRPDDIWETSVEENRRNLIEQLKEFYNFAFEDAARELEIYTLTGYDSTKLSNAGEDVAGTSVKSVNKTKTFSNYSFDRFMEALEKEFDVVFISGVDDNSKYNFETISMANVEQALNDLKQQYNMEFKKSNEMADVKIVSFE